MLRLGLLLLQLGRGGSESLLRGLGFTGEPSKVPVGRAKASDWLEGGGNGGPSVRS